MQGFAGLILFSVFLLMALGLAIIFGQMGVINMAHGEFMILGAYMTYLCSHLVQTYVPGIYVGYFFIAMVVAFIVSGALGLAVEWLLIRHLYARPLDTLLATWGLSLIMQQAFRSIFGAREVGVELPDWMMGSLPRHRHHRRADQRPVRDGARPWSSPAIVALLMYRSRWGLQVRAVVPNRTMSGAVGIDTRRIDRLTFGLGCGIAGIAGSAFTMIGSTSPTARPALHRRHLPGGRVRRRAEPARHHRVGASPSRSRNRRSNSSCPGRWRRCSRCSSSSGS